MDYEKYLGLLTADARRRILDASLAEDCAQETMLIYLNKVKAGATFEDEKALYAFLLKVNAYNAQHIIRCEAKESAIGEEPFLVTSEEPPLLDDIIRREEAAKLDAALSSIPFHHAVATICHFGYDMTYDEVAKRVGNSKDSVRRYSERGIEELKKKLGE